MMTLFTASRKSFSVTVFLRARMAYMPEQRATHGRSVNERRTPNRYLHTRLCVPAGATCAMQHAGAGDVPHRTLTRAPAATCLPRCTRSGCRRPWSWGTGARAARSGCRARSSWCACGSGKSACGWPGRAGRTPPAARTGMGPQAGGRCQVAAAALSIWATARPLGAARRQPPSHSCPCHRPGTLSPQLRGRALASPGLRLRPHESDAPSGPRGRTLRSRRPGRSSAGSSVSGRLVAMSTWRWGGAWEEGGRRGERGAEGRPGWGGRGSRAKAGRRLLAAALLKRQRGSRGSWVAAARHGACLDVAARVEAVQLVHDLQHSALDLRAREGKTTQNTMRRCNGTAPASGQSTLKEAT